MLRVDSEVCHVEVAFSAAVVAEVIELIGFGLETLQIVEAGLQVSELRREVLHVVRLLKLWAVRWLQNLALYLLPVDYVEPRVVLNILSVCSAAA